MPSFYCCYDLPYRPESASLWPGPIWMTRDAPKLGRAPCFAQFIHKDGSGKPSEKARKNLATLTAKTAKSRAQLCKKKLTKFLADMGEFEKMLLNTVDSETFRLRDWIPPRETVTWKSSYTKPESKKIIKSIITAECQYQTQKGKDLCEKTVRFYEEKAIELQMVEKSLEESKKQAQKTMEEHWEIITNSQWSPLNNPHILQNVLSFLRLRDLDSVMRTCSQMLHFVHFQVPVSVIALDMGNQSFNKWLTSFHHFHSLDCLSNNNWIFSENMKRSSMYRNLAAIAKTKRIDSLTVGQPANFKSKNFQLFQKIFQKHQKHLVELTVEASMVPCFLTDEQLGKLKKLTLLNLNKNNENVSSWIESFEKLTSLEVLTISCFDFDLKKTSVPVTVRKLQVLRSIRRVKRNTRNGMTLHEDNATRAIITVPDIEHCENLEELWLDGVRDLTSLSALTNPLKMLKIRYFQRSGAVIWPTSLHAKKLALSRSIPPLNIVKTEELTLAHMSLSDVTSCVSSPISKDLSVFQISGRFATEAIVKLEHSLQEGVTFGLSGGMQFHPSEPVCARYGISLHLKYALMDYAKFPNRCNMHSMPIREVPNHWLYWKGNPGFCSRRTMIDMNEVMRWVERDLKLWKKRSRKRERMEDDMHEGEPRLKQQKLLTFLE